jgi:hypothetical protein
MKGLGIFVSLLQKIYGENGYYLPWSEDARLLFGRQVGEPVGLLDEVLNGLLRRSLFNKRVFESFAVLTSHGVQARFLNALIAMKRTRVQLITEYLLIDPSDYIDKIEVELIIPEETLLIPEETPLIPEETPLIPELSTREESRDEKKGKERKGKERRGEKRHTSSQVCADDVCEFEPVSNLLRDRIQKKRQQKITEKTIQSWNRTVRLMVEKDKRNPDDIVKLINECHDMPVNKGGFTWADNILSMDTLRLKWNEGRIYVGMNAAKSNSFTITDLQAMKERYAGRCNED